jgi:hypothetical protein
MTYLTHAEALSNGFNPSQLCSYTLEKAGFFIKKGDYESAQTCFVRVLRKNIGSASVVERVIKLWSTFDLPSAISFRHFATLQDSFYADLSKDLPFLMGAYCISFMADENYKLLALSHLHLKHDAEPDFYPLLTILGATSPAPGWLPAVQIELNNLSPRLHDEYKMNVLEAFRRRGDLITHVQELILLLWGSSAETPFIALIATLDIELGLSVKKPDHKLIALLPTYLVIQNFVIFKFFVDREEDLYNRARSLLALAKHLIQNNEDPIPLLEEMRNVLGYNANAVRLEEFEKEDFRLQLMYRPRYLLLGRQNDRNRILQIADRFKSVDSQVSQRYYKWYCQRDISNENNIFDSTYVQVVVLRTYDMPEYFVSCLAYLNRETKEHALLNAVEKLAPHDFVQAQFYLGMIETPFMRARAYLRLWAAE